MNEHEFRDALRASMATNPEPPPMSDAPVLDAAKRDRRRRRTLWAGAGSATAVAAIAVGVVVVAPSSSDGESSGPRVGSPPSVTSTGPASPGLTSSGGPGQPDTETNTETSWPSGQTDRTARSGPQAERGEALLADLAASVPPGYESPDDLDPGGLSGSLKNNQAQYADTVDGVGGVEVWEYMASVPVAKGKGVGRLLAEVHTPGNRETGEGCDLAPALWGMAGDCAEVTVDGKQVAVVTITNDERFGQWAGYRYEDGTVVFVAQSVEYFMSGHPKLPRLPLTSEQLAELAADARFDLD